MDSSLREHLGLSLAALIEAGPAKLVSARVLSAPSASPDRCAFEFRFADGSRCKGRRFASPAAAEAACTLLRHLDHPMLPPPFARHHDATLEPWIDGSTLAESTPGEHDVRACGSLLGTLHASDPPPAIGRTPGFAPRSIESIHVRLHENLRTLVKAGLLEGSRAEGLLRSAAADRPANEPVGIIHRDLCPENIVRTADGRLVVIDNALLTIGPLAEDLWRVWYRWHMTDAQWQAFLDAYRQTGGSAAWRPDAAFWPIVVIINSARVRLQRGEAHARAPIERLDAFLAASAPSLARAAAR